jgi:hypothetical protein
MGSTARTARTAELQKKQTTDPAQIARARSKQQLPREWPLLPRLPERHLPISVRRGEQPGQLLGGILTDTRSPKKTAWTSTTRCSR